MQENKLDEDEARGGTIEKLRKSFIPLYIIVFFVGANFAIIIPSIAPYLKNEIHASSSFLAWVISLYSIGEVIGSNSFGWITNRFSTKLILIITLILGACGQLLYALSQNVWMLLAARLISGIWSGADKTVERAYVVRASSEKDRVHVMASFQMAAILGSLSGPGLGAAVSFIDFPLLHGLRVDKYTAPGYLGFLVCIGSILLLLIGFKEKKLNFKPTTPTFSTQTLNPSQKSLLSLPFITVFISLLLLFVNAFTFALFETIIVPLVLEYYDWHVFESNLLFFAAGAMNFAAILVIKFASESKSLSRIRVEKWFALNEERYLIAVFNLTLGVIAFTLWSMWGSSLPLPAFLVGFALFNIEFPVGRVLIFSMYSKLFRQWGHHMGTLMGWLVAVGAIARIGGPFFAVYTFDTVGPYVLFGVPGGLLLGSLVLLLLFWTRFRTMSSVEEQEGSNVMAKKEHTKELTVENIPILSPEESSTIGININGVDDWDREASDVGSIFERYNSW